MKPIFLSIQAFGPFSNSQAIDFNLLGSAPLFLINGATGAGKSSILDAICYALYGETTGNERTGDQMRCDYADAHLLTEVSFTFSLGCKTYQVTRSPDQQVPKKRGDGYTKRTHKAELVSIDGDIQSLIASKPTEVNKHVLELIGLDAKQFRQVMVLPQGRFRELLTANSKEREVIFGQLFQTHIYNAIERALFEQSADIRKQKEGYDNQIKGVLDSAGVESESDLENQLSVASNELIQHRQSYQEKKQRHEQAKLNEKKALEIASKFTKFEDQKIEIKAHHASIDEFNEKEKQRKHALSASFLGEYYEKVENNSKRIAQYRNDTASLSSQIKSIQEKKDNAEEELALARKEHLRLNEFEQHLFKLRTIGEKLTRVDDCAKKRESTKQDINREQLSLNSINKEVSELSQKVAEKQKALDSARITAQELPMKKQAVEQLSDILVKLKNRAKQNHQLSLAQKEEQRLIDWSGKLFTQVNEAEQKTQELEFHWHSSQAAILAKTLKIGQSCPVCGSIEHPQHAEFSGIEVTLEMVESAREYQQEFVKQTNKVKEDLSQQQVLVATLSQHLALIDEQVAGCSFDQDEILKELAKLNSEIQVIESTLVADLEKELDQLKQLVDHTCRREGEQAQKIKVAEQKLAGIEATLSEIKRDVPEQWQSLEALTQEIQSTKSTISRIESRTKLAEQAVQAELSSLTKVQAEEKQLVSLIGQTQSELTAQEADWADKLAQSPFEDLQHYLNCRLTESEIADIEQYINHYQQKTVSLNAIFSNLEKELAGVSQPIISELEVQTKQTGVHEQEAMEQVNLASSTVDRLEKAQQSLSALKKQNAQLEDSYQVVGTLSEVANGRTGSKVSLHRFVLGVLLDDVLILASKRLNKMTQGRYDLRRKLCRSKGNAGSGLELVVEDGYTGKQRDVATLSGGESFMAALSLALGLSDVVQSYSGGIRLDTLFIDEGFGSLDQESLDLAIQALIDLQQGGRTIGIISHVSELKEQIALRVDVISNRTGSDIKVVS